MVAQPRGRGTRFGGASAVGDQANALIGLGLGMRLGLTSKSSIRLPIFLLGCTPCPPRAAGRRPASPVPCALRGDARMRKFPLVLALTSLVVTPALAEQREDGVWHVRGDNNEIVHVLPDPASAEAFEHRFGMSQAPTQQNGYSVFSPSYGSNPGQLNDHGGSVVSNAAFQPVFYNAATATALQSGVDAFVNNFSNSDPGMKVITQYSKSGNAIAATL